MTFLSKFYFLHHPQILPCLKAINKYKKVHAHLCALCSHACVYHLRRAKLFVSKHSTILSNFNFLHHSQILHCLKAITKYKNMHACLCALRSHACTYHSIYFWCILDTSSIILSSLKKIQPNLAGISWFIYCPNLHAHLHVL